MTITHECGAVLPAGAIVCGTCGGTVDPDTLVAPRPDPAPSRPDPSGAADDPVRLDPACDPGDLVCPVPWCGRTSPKGSVECAFCGEPLPPGPASRPAAGEAAPDPAGSRVADTGRVSAPGSTAVLLVLPDGSRVGLPAGRSLLVGRESDSPEVRRALAPYDGVSRRHARIEVDGITLRVEDLGSTNGTWVDDHPAAPRLDLDLRSAGVLRLGGFARIHLLPTSPGGTT